MARESKSAFPPGQAEYLIRRLFEDRRIASGDVSRYLAEMDAEIQSLEKQIELLRSAAHEVAAPARRRAPVLQSPERLESQQLQGRFIAALRHVPKRQRAKFAAIAKKAGRQAAIDAIAATRK